MLSSSSFNSKRPQAQGSPEPDAEAAVWRSAYLALDAERNLWHAKLREIEQLIDTLSLDPLDRAHAPQLARLSLPSAQRGQAAQGSEVERALESKIKEMEGWQGEAPERPPEESGADDSKDAAKADKRLIGSSRENDGPSYVLALLDVETLILSRSLLKKGRKGGERAALLLSDALSDAFAATSSASSRNSKDENEQSERGMAEEGQGDLPLVAFAFVDRFELGRFLMAEGVIDAWTTLDDFVLGFNGCSVGLCALIDTAAADVPRRLGAHFKFYGAQASCAQVLLATSEVGRYKRLLAGLAREKVFVAAAGRLTAGEFSTLPVPGLFSRGLSAKRCGEPVERPDTPESVGEADEPGGDNGQGS